MAGCIQSKHSALIARSLTHCLHTLSGEELPQALRMGVGQLFEARLESARAGLAGELDRKLLAAHQAYRPDAYQLAECPQRLLGAAEHEAPRALAEERLGGRVAGSEVDPRAETAGQAALGQRD